jgi:hypothetical protein
MKQLPDFMRVAGESYEVVPVSRIVLFGAELDCRVSVACRRFYVIASAPVAFQRRALARTIRQLRRMASARWAAA